MIAALRNKIGLLLVSSPILFCGACSVRPDEILRRVSEMFIGLVLVPLVVLSLAWFLYHAFLRKMIRARNIRVLRERREMREVVARSRKR